MLSEARLIGFIPVTNTDRSRQFYVETLGLMFVSSDGFAVVLNANGNMLRLVRFETVAPAPFTILGWEVQGIEEVVRRLVKAGVLFRRFPGLAQDEAGIWTAPGGDRVAWFEDPDGNLLSVSEHVRP